MKVLPQYRSLYSLMLFGLSSCALSDSSRSAGAYYILEAQELARCECIAKKGDIEAIRTVWKHYLIGLSDVESSLQWSRLGAELNDPALQYSYGFSMIDSTDPTQVKEGYIWLEKSADSGFETAKELLMIKRREQKNE